MNKQELTDEQKQKVTIGSYFGFAGVMEIIASITCFAIRSNKLAQLNALKKGSFVWDINHLALESAISTCNIVGILCIILAIVCTIVGCLALYKAGVFNTKKENK